MGQVLSYIWNCLHPRLKRNTTQITQDDSLNRLIDQSQQPQSHHCISIPDADTNHASGSNLDEEASSVTDFTISVPFIALDLSNEVVTTPVLEKQIVVNKEVITIPEAVITQHQGVLSTVTGGIIPQLPSVVVKKNEQDCDQEVEKKIGVNKKEIIDNASSKRFIKRIGQYTSEQEILLVGEGDFSFSACLAVSFENAFNITATSFNSEDFLVKNYGDFQNNKIAIQNRGGIVILGVDARGMAKLPAFEYLKFDCIIFNFPHAGRFGETDDDLRKHKELVRGFFRNAKKMIKEHGEIHVTHKSNGFYLKWNVPKIGSDQGLELIEEVNFKQRKYPGYHTKYGFGGDKDFNCNPSKTYKFRL